MNKLLILLLAGFIAFFAVSCSEDDDSGTDSNNDTKAWIGVWLSAGSDVAPILTGNPFNLDSVKVTLNEDLTVKTEQHVINSVWITTEGTYSITENEGSSILTVHFIYPAFEQKGIMEITDGSPDIMKLEAIQTQPDYGFVPRTVETGFGSDPLYGSTNIQIYKRVE
ncbi:MAG: hypothetical protein H6627_14225 [Calditrichae bacterium]|nr:hypothetical protein [Calditrichia bacterium]